MTPEKDNPMKIINKRSDEADRPAIGREDFDYVHVDKSLPKALYYEKLYQVANARGLKASIEVKTSPVSLSDGNIMPDGLCGFAWVLLPDGRKGFARWIIKNELGNTRGGGGVWISSKVDRKSLPTASSQSMDRNEAYAVAFSKVLKANGVDSFTESSLD